MNDCFRPRCGRLLRKLTLLPLLALAMAVHARAGDASVPGEILVKLRTSDALPALLTKYSLALTDRFGARPIFRLKVVGAATVGDTIAALSTEPSVLVAERNFVHQSPEARRNLPWTVGNPSDYVAQWAPAAIRLPEAHATSMATRCFTVEVYHPRSASELANAAFS